MAMEKREGVPYAEGIKKVWMKDSRGLIVKASRLCTNKITLTSNF